MESGVEVWLVSSALADVDDDRQRGWFEWLADDEKAKYGRFATEALRGEYLASRALSRWALSRSIPDVAPSSWRFDRTEAGRPFVAAPVPASSMVPEFNIANAGGLVACAIGPRGIALGVDVEPTTRGDDFFPLEARSRIFSPRELDAIRALNEVAQKRRMVELWTLKEAYLKARSLGISVHLDRVGILATADGFRLDGGALDGDPADWQLDSTTSGASVVAVAIRRRSLPDLPVTYGFME